MSNLDGSNCSKQLDLLIHLITSSYLTVFQPPAGKLKLESITMSPKNAHGLKARGALEDADPLPRIWSPSLLKSVPTVIVFCDVNCFSFICLVTVFKVP